MTTARSELEATFAHMAKVPICGPLFLFRSWVETTWGKYTTEPTPIVWVGQCEHHLVSTFGASVRRLFELLAINHRDATLSKSEVESALDRLRRRVLILDLVSAQQTLLSINRSLKMDNQYDDLHSVQVFPLDVVTGFHPDIVAVFQDRVSRTNEV